MNKEEKMTIKVMDYPYGNSINKVMIVCPKCDCIISVIRKDRFKPILDKYCTNCGQKIELKSL